MQEKYIKVNKPSGVEEYKVLNAFENHGNSYIVMDSKLKDSNQLTITFISKINGSALEYMEGQEWDDFVKQKLIPVVKGNSDAIYFEPQDSYEAGEQFGHPLALKDEHINSLVDNYQLPVENKIEEPILEESDPVVANPEEPVNHIEPSFEQASVIEPIIENVVQPYVQVPMEPVIDVTPVIEETPIEINDSVIPFEQQPVFEEVQNVTDIKTDNELDELKNNIVSLIDKLIEKENELKIREEQLRVRETEINNIKKDAEIALANAQAKEEVATIAFDNAQAMAQQPIIEEGPTLTLSQAA